ncbi:MAG: homoserine dehydrogenase [Actinobacteria bacterium]|uniref:Homoserine dehydrogenase n=1 Tax=freshwater metagenome TaxID=449393 RepID=A0A6J6PS47_9ZZZZ|nr:homoserine dehydrogenase [Actinomycetota bacterium]MSV84572.1 homoserine dehydrogenase [Actinomycetota bacterium]MSX74190.1 homoserine dehydrogenase [Actinomycetota bacterium]MSY22303.1 homoserine dehydrogenase [Actinomycetota bacterium]MTA73197.1 homoserine dehydrogenase [Actinomycetota bacterium]
MAKTVNIGVLGCGNVGAALVELLRLRGPEIEQRTGLRLRVTKVAVRSTSKERAVLLDPGVLTLDAHSVVADPEINLIVEVIGGIEPARELISLALASGKAVVTANKELLANIGTELFAEADKAGVDLLFEAAVAGGVPIVRPLRESLVGEDITRVMGIVNGTTNYILTKMTDEGWAYSAALAEAQGLGYAERDPTADVEGFDAGAKAAIIATIAFGVRVVAGDVYHEGISGVTQTDIEFARRLGYVVKLLAIAERFSDGTVAVRVHPAMVPNEHPLASVRDSFNAVFVQGAAVGDLMFYGRGAGGNPTASAVLGDVVDAAANLLKGTHASNGSFAKANLRPVDELVSPFYVNLEVSDEPGVLAAVAGVFGDHRVSIHSMEQEVLEEGAQEQQPNRGAARLIFITHAAREADVRATLHELSALDSVTSVGSVLRVIGTD